MRARFQVNQNLAHYYCGQDGGIHPTRRHGAARPELPPVATKKFASAIPVAESAANLEQISPSGCNNRPAQRPAGLPDGIHFERPPRRPGPAVLCKTHQPYAHPPSSRRCLGHRMVLEISILHKQSSGYSNSASRGEAERSAVAAPSGRLPRWASAIFRAINDITTHRSDARPALSPAATICRLSRRGRLMRLANDHRVLPVPSCYPASSSCAPNTGRMVRT